MVPPGSTKQQAEAAANSSGMTTLAAVGLVALGLVHLLIGWLALQVAWGGGGEEQADAGGAFGTLAEQPLGTALLWVLAVGLVALALWQVSEAVWGHREITDDHKRLGKRVASGAKAVAYLVLAFSAGRTAAGGGSGSGSAEEGLTSRLLGAPAGQFLVGLLGVGIVVVGVYLVHKGATKRFLRDLEGHGTGGRTGGTVEWLGMVGHVAKGVAYAIVGVLFVTAAATRDAEESGGLDEALTTLREQPFGQWLLTAVALGLVAYGLYAFVWARAMRKKA